jgi:hypothetical protein
MSPIRAKPERSGDAKPRVLKFRTAGLPKRVFASFCPDLLLQDKALTFGNEVSAFFVLTVGEKTVSSINCGRKKWVKKWGTQCQRLLVLQFF